MSAELTVAAPEVRLTRKQEAFVLVIANNPQLTQAEAARRAGCPDNSAKVTACRWLKMPHIKTEIERLQNEILEREGVSRFSVLREMAAVGHSNVLDFEDALKSGDLSKLTRQQAAAIKKLTIEEFEDKPAVEQKGSTLEPQPQGGALQRGSDAQPVAEQKPKLKRRISLELLPKTPALELLGKSMNLWGSSSDGPPIAIAGEQIIVNIRRVGA